MTILSAADDDRVNRYARPLGYIPIHEVKAARESLPRRSMRASMRSVSRTCGW
ncbi:hypothetical protein AB0M95_27200 [Sphaerisporangium sp. NPDC051017]|uniref:hypothetical protein n=1 Tax=Sphaerisporangium sp. NPDC051017 TaxID=3154636 RepID=UPI0034356C4B